MLIVQLNMKTGFLMLLILLPSCPPLAQNPMLYEANTHVILFNITSVAKELNQGTTVRSGCACTKVQ